MISPNTNERENHSYDCLSHHNHPLRPNCRRIFQPLKWRKIDPFRGGRSVSEGVESAFLDFDTNNRRYVMGGQYLGTVEVHETESKALSQVMAALIQYLGREARNMKYLFLLNQTGGSNIPKVNKGSKDRRAELELQ